MMATRKVRRKTAPRPASTGPSKPARRGHPLVDQLRFTRSEWLRGLKGVSEDAGARHFGQMNSIGWIVGHLAWQEQRYLLHRPQGIMLREDIQQNFASGGPMSTGPCCPARLITMTGFPLRTSQYTAAPVASSRVS